MFHKIEDCPRCFTLVGRGFLRRWFLKRKLKQEGHLIFAETKRGKGIWQLVISTRKYPGATYHDG